jgi:hypothetical protein
MKFRRNQPRSQPVVRVCSARGSGTRGVASFQAHLCLRRLSHLTPAALMPERAAPAAGDERQDFSWECGLKRPTKGGITTESFGTAVTTGPEQEEMPIHAHLSQSNYYLIVLLDHKRTRPHS